MNYPKMANDEHEKIIHSLSAQKKMIIEKVQQYILDQ